MCDDGARGADGARGVDDARLLAMACIAGIAVSNLFPALLIWVA